MSMVECSDFEFKENHLIVSPLAHLQAKSNEYNSIGGTYAK
jgi:hypothetical protein